MLKLLPTTLCPVALPILSRFFPNSVHPLYMNLGYEPLVSLS